MASDPTFQAVVFALIWAIACEGLSRQFTGSMRLFFRIIGPAIAALLIGYAVFKVLA